MSRKQKQTLIGLILLAICVANIFRLCWENPDKTAEKIVMTLSELQSAEKLYVSVEESQAIDDTPVNTVMLEGYWDENVSAMWFSEKLSEETNNSFIYKDVSGTQSYGSFDFEGNYTDDFALTFSATQLVSYISLMQSDQFEINPSTGGFTMRCTDEKLILSSNDYIYDNIDDENGSIADLLGNNIKGTLEIFIAKNKYNGVDIVGITNISGDQHYITLTKTTQFKQGDKSLKDILSRIESDKTSYFS